jgi:hypothetical protein
LRCKRRAIRTPPIPVGLASEARSTKGRRRSRENEVLRGRVAQFLRINAFPPSLFAAVNGQSSTTDEQNLILDPWSYDRSPGTEVVQHAMRNLCFQANGVSLLE